MVHSFIIFIENFAKEFFLELICCPFVIYIIQFSRHLAEIYSDLKNEFYKHIYPYAESRILFPEIFRLWSLLQFSTRWKWWGIWGMWILTIFMLDGIKALCLAPSSVELLLILNLTTSTLLKSQWCWFMVRNYKSC